MSKTRKVVRFKLEATRGTRYSFAEIVVDGVRLLVTSGVVDTETKQHWPPQKTGQRFATPEEAMKRAEQILEQRSKHYTSSNRTEEEIPDSGDGVATAAANPTLESQVLAARGTPNEVGPATVYADWLQTNNDVRGELASLFLAGKTADANTWLAHHATRLFGELDVKLDSEIYNLVWSHGFLAGASLKRADIDSRTKLGAMTADFLALPVSRLVTALRFGLSGYESDNDWSDTLAAIAASPQATTLRSLRFDDYHSEDCEISWTAFGDFSPHWAAFPALEVLRIRSGEGGTLGEIDLPNLRMFVRESGGLGADEIQSIMNARWPRLEFLEIWFGDDNYGAAGKPEHLAAFLDGKAPSGLTHLGLVNCEFTHELLESLVRSPVVRKLKSLDLSKGVLMDSDVDVLVKHADAFKHLERFDLSENLFHGRGGEVAAALPNVTIGKQRFDGEDNRYVALGE